MPRPGSRPRYRTALRVLGGSVLEAHIDYQEEVSPQSEVGIRVRAASGADGTCEQPLPDDFLPISSVSDDSGGRVDASEADGDLEISIPATGGRYLLRVTLSSPIADAQLLELDLVRRKAKRADDEGEATGSES